MIYIGQIPNIYISDYDEVWWIVRSPDAPPKEEKIVLGCYCEEECLCHGSIIAGSRD